ncbi:MAG: 50S ribosomal protein L6 [Nitrospina sp.]|jgi:large subunit ribosomal protein L6|nr:50S ribosomal protein L6 [Nitrospina sp.]MBT6120463.1 50S ribosomal protein L6 [bacterium]
MSRIGKKPVFLKDGAKVEFNNGIVKVSGPKGTLAREIAPEISLSITDTVVKVERSSEDKKIRAKHGLYRSLIKNMVEGVTVGFLKDLELVGVGYRVKKEGNGLNFSLGYSHPVVYACPEGIDFTLEGQTKIKISGIDKELVGSVAANLVKLRKPDAYKGKGVRFVGVPLKLKAGKSVKK